MRFNPTLVRFNVRLRDIKGENPDEVSIPHWFDSTVVIGQLSDRLSWFQSHTGSIQRVRQAGRRRLPERVSILTVTAAFATTGSRRRLPERVSIPHWFDSTLPGALKMAPV